MSDTFRLTIECSVGISELNIKFNEDGPIVTQSRVPSAAPTKKDRSVEDVLAERQTSATPSAPKPTSSELVIPEVGDRPVAADKDFASTTY